MGDLVTVDKLAKENYRLKKLIQALANSPFPLYVYTTNVQWRDILLILNELKNKE